MQYVGLDAHLRTSDLLCVGYPGPEGHDADRQRVVGRGHHRARADQAALCGFAYGAPLMRDQGYIPTLIFCRIYAIPLGPGAVP